MAKEATWRQLAADGVTVMRPRKQAGAVISSSELHGYLRSVLILSDKSSGSTILQNELAKHPAVNVCSWTRHQENETLYWCKAAALLGMPQAAMMDSSVLPMSAGQARAELEQFLRENLPDWQLPAAADRLVFDGWAMLCHRYAPVFLEKSPHHLHSPSALSLLDQAVAQADGQLDMKVIGLVRNPVDTLYSMWQRWRTRPELRQREWVRAYQNLRNLGKSMGSRMLTLRYEDLVREPSTIGDVCDFIGVERLPAIGAGIRSGSVSAWSTDRAFGFQPDQSVIDLAETFGYQRSDLSPRRSAAWPIVREARIAQRRTRTLGGRARRFLQPEDES